MFRKFAYLLNIFCLALAPACSRKSEAPTSTSSEALLIDRGRTVYQTTCIACHNADPSKPGALGPEIANSSKALLEARLLRAEYPAGYTPKRGTKTMTAFPYLEKEIDALTSFLNKK